MLFCCYCVVLLFVLFCVLFLCTVPLPPGVNPIAVDKYIKNKMSPVARTAPEAVSMLGYEVAYGIFVCSVLCMR